MESQANSLEKAEDLGTTPEAEARRWKLELKLADKREQAWRKKVKDIYNIYTPETAAKYSFNILWTNTETLRQSVYNSLPQPDARRRYQDEDKLGKAVGEVLTRALEFSQDTYDFDGLLKGEVLSMLLAGRSVSRVVYVPDIKTIGGESVEEDDSDAGSDEEAQEVYEEIDWEQAICQKVQYDDFRILCNAKSWDEVNRVGFKHRFIRDDLVDKFGKELGEKIPLDQVDDDDVKKNKDADLFKTAEVWEIWDKDEKEVIWICPTYPTPLKVQKDPLKLQGFFPIPRPLYAIENDTTLVPATLYGQYEEQAKELNKISARINKLIDGLKVRGIYDSTLSELDSLTKANDNEMIPAENVTALLERGGLEKAIWFMPIEVAAQVLKELYAQRDATKQVIYEVTGISDIMRSASDPNETFGAQKIKTQWGTQRLQRMQREVQRYIRDLIRLKAEIIANKFQPETLEAMTLVQLPHQADLDAQYAQQMQQYQQMVMQAHSQPPQPNQPPPQMPPPPQKPVGIPTWESVVDALRNDATRTYKIDIETDSTLSATQDADMQAIQQGVAALGQIGSVFMPVVQEGAMDIETIKQLMLSITRKMKMGSAVEDALEKIQQPPPKQDPQAQAAQAKAQSDAQQAQAKMQADAQMAQMKMQMDGQLQQAQHQHEMQVEQLKAQNQAQIEQLKAEANRASEQSRMQADAQVEQVRASASIEVEHAKQQSQWAIDEAKRQHELSLAQMTHGHDQAISQYGLEFDKWKVEFENATKVLIAQITAKTATDTAALSAQQNADTKVSESLGGNPDITKLTDMHGKTVEAINGLVDQMKKPKVGTLSSGKQIRIESE